MSNTSLNNALKNKNDEFFTLYEDIEKEMQNWINELKGKSIHLFADSLKSNFWKYFFNNFNYLQLKKLTATSLNKKCYFTNDGITIKEEDLENGDCLSNEIFSIMRMHDICITNPPFSIGGQLIPQLIENNITFLILGPETLVSRKNLFNYFKDNKIKFGYNTVRNFLNIENQIQRFGNISWLTNLNKPDNPPLPLSLSYNPSFHLKADNYNCINIDKLIDIPYDYYEPMAVPITYLKKHCKNQFIILGLTKKGMQGVELLNYNKKDYEVSVNGKKKFSRIFIQRIK